MRGIAAISLRVYSACGVRNSVSEGANSCAWEVLAFGGATTDFTLAAFDGVVAQIREDSCCESGMLAGQH
ncbi:hypothetical protein DW2_13220, partial [Thioclava atlantica]